MERTFANLFKSVSIIHELEDIPVECDMSSKISGGRVEAAEELIFMDLFVGRGGPGGRMVAIIFEFERVGKAEVVADVG